MIDPTLQTPIPPLSDLVSSLTLLFTALAAVVSLFILWFTVIKAPDLHLVRNIKLEIGEAPATNLRFDGIGLKSIPLLFVNNGAKSCVLTEVRAEFKPYPSFTKFFRSVQQSIVIKSSIGKNKELPLTVPEKTTAVVTLSLSIAFKPWKDLSRLDELSTIPLSAALQTIWQEGVSRLKDFSNFADDVGTFDIMITRMKRRYFRMSLVGSVVASRLPVGAVPKSYHEIARHDLNNFSELRDTDAELVQKIRSSSHPFLSDCNTNKQWLVKKFRDVGVTRMQTSGPDSLFEWERSNDPAIHVLRHEKDILTKVTTYGQQVKQYNEMIQVMAPGYPIPLDNPSPDVEAIDGLMSDLLKKTIAIEEDLLKFREKLRTETERLVQKRS